VNLVTIRGGGHEISGTLGGRRGESRIVVLDGHTTDVPPATNMLVVRNDDRPGMIGVVGTALGDGGINIADMDVGRAPSGSALMVLATTAPVPPEIIHALETTPGIISIHPLSGASAMPG
jgi:D-3-phosphoglycerate dehydrogenase